MTPGRIIHGREAEPRRLYNWEGPSRAGKRRLTYTQAVGLLCFVAGVIAGGVVL